MKNVPMRFCGYTFHHNPATLKIEHTGRLRELEHPYSLPYAEHLGNRLRRVTGEGELYGADCIAQFLKIKDLFENGEAGLLSLPRIPAMYAYLKELTMTAEPKEDILTYRFLFVEAHLPEREESSRESYETIVDCESLWDISYRFGVPIDTLVQLNPQIGYIDTIAEGVSVRLC